jgi:hypothetical protein
MTTFVGAYAEAADNLLARASAASGELGETFSTRMKATVDGVPKMIRAIGDMIDNPDVTVSEQGNFYKMTDRVEEAERFTTAAINTQNAILGEWEADLARRESAATGFDRGSPDAERILNKFAAKSQAEQLQDMAAWLKDPKLGYRIGIVSKADDYTTNLTPEMAERFKRDFVKLHAPALAAEREAMGSVHSALMEVAKLTTRVKASLSDTRRYAEIRDRKAKHSAADAAFLAALGKAA